jgi:hypothetical protein
MKHWIPSALLPFVVSAGTALAATVTNIVPRPGAMQPGGDPTDTTLNFGTWWNGNGTVTEAFDSTMHSQEDIAGSLHVIFDCPGGTVTPIASANLAFGNFFSSLWGDNGWLGAANTFDASKYKSLTFDINIATTVSSNTDIPVFLYGASYDNVQLTNLPITTPGWQHIELPISQSINLADMTAYGVYAWYNTTASTPPAHVEYWMDNVTLVAREVPLPPPTLSLEPVTQPGLLFDSAPGEGGQRGAIDTVLNLPWTSVSSPAAPTTYAMTISSVPDPTIYSNYEAHIFLAPNGGVGNPDWNLPDMGYLQILSRNDGTAIARMMWKTNDANDNTMLFNEQPGGTYGTNGYAAGTLGYLTAPTMVGTWSISFTSDTGLLVKGPGGVSATFNLPPEWLASYQALPEAGSVYAYFGAGPNGADNAGQPLYLSKVFVDVPGGGYSYTNTFASAPVDSTTWALLGNETVVVPPQPAWWVKWTLPAADFNLWTKADLGDGSPWIQLTGTTNLAAPAPAYAWGTNMKVLVPKADLAGTAHNFFQARKIVASQLQVLMPGETNAPFTATGKVGTPDPQYLGTFVEVTLNAVDANWNIVSTCADTVHLTSSDASAVMPADAALVNGTGLFYVGFMTVGDQTVTASDVTNPSVADGTSSAVPITQ